MQNKVTAYNCVLGEKEGFAQISHCDLLNIGGTDFSESKDQSGIEMKALGSFSFDGKVDFVKMDVEGFEYQVLQGSKDLLLKDKPILWIEIFNRNYSKVSQLLSELGYKQIEALDRDNYIFMA